MRLLACLAALLAGCGARSALEIEPPERADAGDTPTFDGGTFTTFPCRWTLGLSTLVATGDGWTDLTGAVHPMRNQAAVLATETSTGERRGAVVSIAASGGVDRELEAAAMLEGELFTGVTDYVRQIDEGCRSTHHDESFTLTDRAGWPTEGGRCWLTQAHVGRIESVSPSGEVLLLDGIGSGPVGIDRVGFLSGGARDLTRAFYDAETTTVLAARMLGGGLVLERHLPRGEEEHYMRSARASGLSASADPLRGGMMVHYRDEDGWHLEHLDWESGRPPQDHLSLAGLPEPAGPITTNETEILMPLIDGRIAYAPFALVELMVRWVDPVEGGPVETMQVILRPGESGGGVLYATTTGELRFQPLICNR